MTDSTSGGSPALETASPFQAGTHVGNPLIQKFLNIVSRLVVGQITVVLPDGSNYLLSSGGVPGRHAVIRIKRWRAVRKFLTQGDYGFVESYLDGDWESDELSDIIELAVLNTESWNSSKLQGIF